MTTYDVAQIRRDFPILHTENNGKSLIYLDNGATTQKPQCVIDAIVEGYTRCNANVHRGVYRMSREATDRHEAARDRIARFIHAEREELLFTSGTTESINLVAYTLGRQILSAGDKVVVSVLEHHSNFVPWQQIAKACGASFEVVPVLADGTLDMEALTQAIDSRTKVVSIAHVSNVLGTVNPVESIVELAHRHGAVVLLDGAQAIAHLPVDVKALNCDFYAFSSHKIYGPTGMGVLYGKRKWLETMPPFLYGGEMIEHVSIAETTFNDLPYKFEAGTPNFIGSHAFATAIDYVDRLGLANIAVHERQLLEATMVALKEIEGMRFVGTATDKAAVVSFDIEGVHPYDLAVLLDEAGIALRTGHHCAEPLLSHFGLNSTIRASFGLYNTLEEVELFVQRLKRVLSFFRR